jgi:phosphopantothenoylcysteine decarboxylase/phosphopantothenate--cysteine ligase
MKDTLKNKRVVLGVCGGIAAYKACGLVSLLTKAGAEVKVIMTKSAREFVTKLTFQTLSKNPVAADLFEEPNAWEIGHIALEKWADVLVIAPATANTLAKIACGIADDMLSAVALACGAPLFIAPAMNTDMYENAVTRENIEKLRARGAVFIGPKVGRLACGDVGRGAMEEPEIILESLALETACAKDLKGVKILVTAGATVERFDPVRCLSNPSTGKMGFAVAQAAAWRGANVTLVSGKTHLTPPLGVETVFAESAADMAGAVFSRAPEMDVLIKAAAVSDYRPAEAAAHKLKKDGDLTVRLERTVDILKELGKQKGKNQILVGFCMETENLLENARKKLAEKNLDLIAANGLFAENAGFAAENNSLTLLSKNAPPLELPNMPKREAAMRLLDAVAALRNAHGE